ncbi:hypothetical protein NZ35_11180 [Pseudomonas chlororaphis]|uniref:Uncharacterized protein n=1 Tax=Pseudomonas chlororaphis TaxID=587753 RepID=A0A0A6DFE4_9PSED|nr:hypothetical protein NZ35_11180 [Pseudomonas chlororaphis]
MALAQINSEAFTAHLYLDGRPVVLNQQRLQKTLSGLRITQAEKLDAEVGLADSRVCSFITLADHEDHTPLLLKFVPKGNEYAISIELAGTFDGARLFMEDKTNNLLASTSAPVQYFSFSTYGVPKASFSNIKFGPAYLELISQKNNRPLYRLMSGSMSTFVNADPNKTGHDAFNNKSSIFVIKVIKPHPATV